MYSLTKIAQAVPGPQPAGQDLSLTGELLEIELMAKPVRPTNVDGQRIADDFSELDPDWIKLEARCVALFEISRDLRVATLYTAALLRVHGFPGLAHGLELIRRLIGASEYHVHPQIETNDAAAFLERWHTVAAVSVPYKQDGDLLRIIEGIRNVPLGKSAGIFYRYHDVVAVRQQAGGKDTATIDRVRNEWKKGSVAERVLTVSSLKEALEAAVGIETILLKQTPEECIPVGASARPLQVLVNELKNILEFVTGSALQPQVAASAVGEVRPAVSGELYMRSDAIKVLVQVAEYFRKTEPASPVPYFIDRAVRLVDRDFMSLLGDLVPDAVSRFQTLTGVEDSKAS